MTKTKRKTNSKTILKVGTVILAVCLVAGAAFLAKEQADFWMTVKKISKEAGKPRIAVVMIKSNTLDEAAQKIKTTIRFEEEGAKGVELAPRVFTFEGNSLQIATVAIPAPKGLLSYFMGLRGKKIPLYLKFITRNDPEEKEQDLVNIGDVPDAYRLGAVIGKSELKAWKRVWKSAVDKNGKLKADVEIASIPLSASYFLPGTVFKLKLNTAGEATIETQTPNYMEESAATAEAAPVQP